MMHDSKPLRYSGMAGGEVTAKMTWRVICFCTLLVGHPFYIIIDPNGGGYPSALLFCASAAAGCEGPLGGGSGAPWATTPRAGANPGFLELPAVFKHVAGLLVTILSFNVEWMVQGPHSLSYAKGHV